MKRKKNLNRLYLISGLGVVIVGCFLFFLWGNKKTFTVQFDTGEGSSIKSQLVSSNGQLVEPKDPILDGYIFDGWFVGDEKFDFNETPTKNLTLKAKWIKIGDESEEFTITFDSNEGSKVSPLKVKKGEKALEPKDPTKDGYDFVSWQLDGEDYDFDALVTGNIKLVATWEKKSSTGDVIKHKVTFNSNGGSAVSSKLVEKGTKVSKPKNPTKSGYIFDGWYLNSKLFNFNTKIYDNIKLTAKWKAVVVEEKQVTYSIAWIKIESSSIGQYNLFIKSSEGNYVSGKVKITTTAGTTSIIDVSNSGKTFIKSAIESASVESVN